MSGNENAFRRSRFSFFPLELTQDHARSPRTSPDPAPVALPLRSLCGRVRPGGDRAESDDPVRQDAQLLFELQGPVGGLGRVPGSVHHGQSEFSSLLSRVVLLSVFFRTLPRGVA